MTNLIDFYRDYGQTLASRLPLAGGAQFVFVEDMGDPAEVLQFLNSAANTGGTVLVWEQFMETADTGGRDNYHSELHGSLAILQKGMDRAARRAAQVAARPLVLHALALMLHDSEEGSLLDENIRLELRQLPLMVIGPVGANWYGYGLEFTWLAPLELPAAD